MEFTFGIITDGNNDELLSNVVESINNLNIPRYEIIIVGNSKVHGENIVNIPFDENKKTAWITKKKNLITENASYENIVYSHDYIIFEKDWYDGFLKFGNGFDVCMTKMLNKDGTRFRDWVIWAHNSNEMDQIVKHRDNLIPYDITHLSKYMYISGSYWVAKKKIMEIFKLDESLSWGQGEDVAWSISIRQHCIFSMNTFSSVSLLKMKDPVFFESSNNTIKILREYEKD